MARPTNPSTSTNLVVLTGVLSSAPVVRALPSGDHLVTYEVTCGPYPDGAGSKDERPTTTVPVVRFLEVAPPVVGDEGDVVAVLGFVRRRFYRTGGATQSRTEVVAQRLHIGPTKRQSSALVKRAAVLAGAGA